MRNRAGTLRIRERQRVGRIIGPCATRCRTDQWGGPSVGQPISREPRRWVDITHIQFNQLSGHRLGAAIAQGESHRILQLDTLSSNQVGSDVKVIKRL